MQRGEIWWTDLGPSKGSSPARSRPVLIVQTDSFNASRIGTVIVAAITSNLRLADAPGNVLLTKRASALPTRSVVNVSQIATIDKRRLTEAVSSLATDVMDDIDRGLRLVLGLYG